MVTRARDKAAAGWRTTKGACRHGSGGGEKGKKNGLVRDGGGVFPDGPRPSRTGSNTFWARD